MTAFDYLIVVSSIFLFCFLVYFIMIILPKIRIKLYESKFNYKTKHGLLIKLSPLLKDLKKEEFEEWTDDLISFWSKAENFDIKKVNNSLNGVEVILQDVEYLIIDGRKANGYLNIYLKYRIQIATLYKKELDINIYTPYKKVKSLFRHEMSHVILEKNANPLDIPYDEQIHHKIFKDLNLGA